MQHEIRTGDVCAVLREHPANSFDACLTDPPYGLEFMGRDWDRCVPAKEVWQEVFRVLKPGAYALIFGGTRTFHRLACAVEDAGFEIRDCLMWLYGSGFPKGQDISKALDKAAGATREVVGPSHYANRGRRTDNQVYGQSTPSNAEVISIPATDARRLWQGYNTTLKPAWEPILLCMKPLDRTFAQNALKHGTGGLAVDACRIGTAGGCRSDAAYTGGDSANCFGKGLNDQRSPAVDGLGRWPANLLLDEDAAAALDGQTGDLHATGNKAPKATPAAGNEIYGKGAGEKEAGHIFQNYKDSGGASRFFYVAKASSRERGNGNNHPTVKPVKLTAELARYLLTLVLPPSRAEGQRKLLVPFSGSGSEIIGAREAGWEYTLGIELEPAYAAIAEQRLAA